MYMYNLKETLYQNAAEQYVEGYASIFDITGIGRNPIYKEDFAIDNNNALKHDEKQVNDDLKQAYLDATVVG